MYSVYEIRVNGIRRYIGSTNDFFRRKREHLKSIKLAKKKELYEKINEILLPEIEFNILFETESKIHCLRKEVYFILEDYFNKNELWQAYPKSFKYY